MPQQEPFTPSEREVAVSGADTDETAPVARYADEPMDEHGDWLEEPDQLPRRPHRRLLGKGGNPIAVALLGILLAACGFIGGVLVEKGEASSSSSTGGAASLASRFRSLAAGTSTSSGSGSTGGASALPGGFTRPTSGTVAYLEGSTLYVTNAEGNTVKVSTSRGTSVSKSVKSSVNAIHPGEAVTITGSTASNGTVTAESISVGSSAGGGLAALFGGASGRGGSGTGAGSGGGKEPALFGNGG